MRRSSLGREGQCRGEGTPPGEEPGWSWGVLFPLSLLLEQIAINAVADTAQGHSHAVQGGQRRPCPCTGGLQTAVSRRAWSPASGLWTRALRLARWGAEARRGCIVAAPPPGGPLSLGRRGRNASQEGPSREQGEARAGKAGRSCPAQGSSAESPAPGVQQTAVRPHGGRTPRSWPGAASACGCRISGREGRPLLPWSWPLGLGWGCEGRCRQGPRGAGF